MNRSAGPRILFMAPSYSIHGGVTRWLVDLHEGLTRLGAHCAIALADGARFHRAEPFRQAYPGAEYIPLDGRTGTPAGRIGAARRAIRAFAPDVVVPVMLADGLRAAAEGKSQGGYRIVYAVHEVNPGVATDLALCGHAIDALVAVDRRSHDAYAGFAPPGSPAWARMIPCGVARAAGPRDLPAFDGRLRIGYCGRIEDGQKRVLDLVPLCAELARLGIDFELSVAGDGSVVPELRRRLALLPSMPAVRFLGALSREALYESFYPAIDLLVICSQDETGPLVAFEAMMHGRLVVTSDFDGRERMGSLVGGVNCLVFPVGDMRDAAGKIARTLSEPAAARAMADRGREDAAGERTLDQMTQRWLEVLDGGATASPLPPLASPAGGVREGGLMARLGIPPGVAEAARRLTRRRFLHAFPGQEWPAHLEAASRRADRP